MQASCGGGSASAPQWERPRRWGVRFPAPPPPRREPPRPPSVPASTRARWWLRGGAGLPWRQRAPDEGSCPPPGARAVAIGVSALGGGGGGLARSCPGACRDRSARLPVGAPLASDVRGASSSQRGGVGLPPPLSWQEPVMSAPEVREVRTACLHAGAEGVHSPEVLPLL